MRWLFLFSALLLSGPALADPTEGLVWTWDEDTPHRWFVDNEVQMASYLWLMADRNKEARLVAFRVQSILDCDDIEPYGRRQVEMTCTIEAIALMGATLRGDRGLMQPILEEVEEKLTGATLGVRMRHDGRITNIALRGVDRSERRRSRTHEALRLILSRSLAGFDLQLPRGGETSDPAWPQRESLLLHAPTHAGSQGAAEIAHLVREVREDQVILETAGRALISPGTDSRARNFHDTRLDAVAVFDTGLGLMRERVWNAVGTPTASSAMAVGGRGIEYIQRGRILYLGDGAEVPEFEETAEVPLPDGDADSVLHVWTPWSAGPPRGR